MKNIFKFIAAALAANTVFLTMSAVASADKLKTIDGVKYLYSDSGERLGTYSGWSNSTAGRRYYKNGILVKSKWLKKNRKYYYISSNGYAVTGWIKNSKGKYYYFDSSGTGNGIAYTETERKELINEKLSESVKIKVKLSKTLNRNDCLAKGSSFEEKEADDYLNNSDILELELSRAVAEQLSKGDKLVADIKVNKDEGGGYWLITRPSNYSFVARPDKDGTVSITEAGMASEARLDLLNRVLIIKNGKLKLDMMMDTLGLSWEFINNDDYLSYVKDEDSKIVYLDYNDTWDIYYGLFGGYNRHTTAGGRYEYRDGISEKKLIDLMEEIISAHKEALKYVEDSKINVDWGIWAINIDCNWVELEVV